MELDGGDCLGEDGWGKKGERGERNIIFILCGRNFYRAKKFNAPSASSVLPNTFLVVCCAVVMRAGEERDFFEARRREGGCFGCQNIGNKMPERYHIPAV